MANHTPPEQTQAPAASLLDLLAGVDAGTEARRFAHLPLTSFQAISCAAAQGWRADTIFLAAWALAQSRWTGNPLQVVDAWPVAHRQTIDCNLGHSTGDWLAAIDAARRAPSEPSTDAGAPPAIAWGLGMPADRAAPRLQLGLDDAAAAPRLVLSHEAGLLDEATAAELLEAVAAIAERLADSAAWRTLGDIPSLSARQRTQQLTAWNRPPTAVDPASTVVSLFARQVAARPDAIALAQGDERLSYAELDRRAARLAARLQAAGAVPGSVVGVAIDRSTLSVVALLAVLRTGAAYLPLQSNLPAERLAFMVGDAGVAVIVSTAARADRLPSGPRVVCADADDAAAATVLQPVAIDAESLAYVIYTSGSTGTPKGTEIRHGGIVRLVVGSDTIDLSPESVVMHSVPLGLDVSTAEIWGPLLNGGCCVVHDEDMLTGPGLARTVAAHGVRTVFVPVALFNTLVDGDPMHLAGLRQVFIGGEAISVPHVRRAMAALPDVQFVNAYGPTECTTIATAYPIPAALPATAMTLPIGRPIADTTAFVTGPTLELLPAGLIGELCLGGRGVARGYVGRPGLTAERFVADPFAAAGRLYRTGDRARLLPDGLIDFLGRQDGQIKIRGHRIEIGEIEAALAAQPGLSANCVVGVKDASGSARLVAYLVAKADAPSWETLRSALASQLPEVMVPTAHVWLDALPLNVNGKVDRRALPTPSAERPDTAQPYEAPRGAIEQRVADAFARALGIDRVGRRDNFFALGGDSLRVLKVLADLQKDHAQSLAPQLVFGAPTPMDLVAALAAAPAGALARRTRPAGAGDDAIAVIAMAGRFPGAADVEALWENLLAGKESIRRFDDAELDPWVTPALRADPAYVRARGVVDDVDLFDAAFFGIGAREAELTDPQQRLFLELSWECLERAGYAPDAAPGTVGVYGGMNNGTYLQRHLLPRPDLTDAVGEVMLTVANEKDYVATRVAHRLNLTGPAISIHTACSTSLVAIAQAFDALRSGACDMALAGGVSITCPPRSGYLYQEGAMLSPDGRTRSFDADARGTVFSDGAAVVLLKPLARALADGDTVCAVLRGAAVNNDGAHKASFTAPSAAGQAAVIAAALDSAGVSARDISYVEAHGTATPVGDPIEIEGLTRAFARDTADTGFCAIGSLKSNVGHMVTAAGAAGLIKTVMALEAGRIPATVNFARPHPDIDFDASPFRVAAAAIDWPRSARPRLAGVSSFGIGGTNAHVIVEEAPLRTPSDADANAQVLLLSARTPAALAAAAARLAAHLDAHPTESLADVAYTLRVGRKAFVHRLGVVADSAAAASAALRTADAPERTGGSLPGWQHQGVLLFPGQGAQYPGMGRTLHAAEPVFRAAFDEVLRAFDGVLDVDLRERMASDDPAALAPTAVTQPATFAFEYAMARQLLATRLAPAALIGHSVGEFVAAVLAGVMSLADAARLVARRGALMQALPAGAMLSVRMPAAQLLARLPDGLSLAADNAPMACVAAGPAEGIAQLQAALEAEGIAVRRLQTSHAFHSSMMAAAVAPFEALVREARLSAPRLPIYSTLTGRLLTAEEATDPGYWARHLREPVRFAGALQAALDALAHPLFVEVGPRNTLATLVRQQATRQRPVQAVSTGCERSGDEGRAWRMALGRLWTLGAEVDLGVLDTRAHARRVRLPTYPFERKRFWIDALVRSALQPAVVAPAALAAAGTAQPVPSDTTAFASDVAQGRATLDARLRNLLASITGLEMAQVDGGTPFIELGLDSLALAQVAVQVKKQFDVDLSFRQLMESHR
ncbi:MAG: amino acid adenylation domain-containing protein, partial [Variovorax sp.]